MRTTMNFTLKEQLKKDFFDLAKKMETTPSNLLNMLMKNAVITKTINISIPNSIELEPFSEEEKASFSSDFLEKTIKLTNKAETLFSKVNKNEKSLSDN